MSLTTKPPTGEPATRADTAPAGGPRAPAARTAVADAASSLRLLVEELITATLATLGPGPRIDPAPQAFADPRQTATALLAWLRAAASARA